MISLIPKPVLSPDERAWLEENNSRGKVEHRTWQRSTIVLAYADGYSLAQTAKQARCSVSTAKRWLRRYNATGIEGLCDLPRSGSPPTHGNRARLALAALATAVPPDPYTQWTYRLLAEHLAPKGHPVSRWWVMRTLTDLELDICHTEGWLNRTGDPVEFATRAKDVCDLLVYGPGDGGVVVCMDEKTGIQAVQRLFDDLPLKEGLRRRIEFEYRRHGTANLQLAYRHDTGAVMWCFLKSNNSDQCCWFLGQVSRWIGGGKPIHLVMDNGSSHVSKQTTAWLAGRDRFSVHLTPKHASWLNPAELMFSSVTRAVIKGRSSTSVADLECAIDKYYEERPSRPVNWTYEWPE